MDCSKRDQDRVDQNVGAGAGVSDGDIHGRRRDVGELRDRKRLDPQHPQEEKDDRDDDRQRRPIENFCEHGSGIISLGLAFLPWKPSGFESRMKTKRTASGGWMRFLLGLTIGFQVASPSMGKRAVDGRYSA